MKTMETELQRQNQELYAMYLRSMTIAEHQWLPNIQPIKDSYNSYPHIKEVMRHVNCLLYEEEENCNFSLNCSELYILLCAILMHDIGKGVSPKPSEKNLENDHGYDSYWTISHHWTVLGLPTKKVAEIIGDICRFHASPDKTQMTLLHTKYYADLTERAEPIRGRFLGALLYLGDHMDDGPTRTVPRFFKDSEPMDAVGNFRSKIADVKLDRQYKMIRVVLDRSCFKETDIFAIQMLHGALHTYVSKNAQPGYMKRPYTSVLYDIANDVLGNEKAVSLIKDELNVMGIPVKKWLIECDEHLFQVYRDTDTEGNSIINSVYALEPIINLDYCMEVLKGICLLAGGIFGEQYFPYSELVNFIREEDSKTYKVRCAVRRLSLLLKTEKDCNYVIYYDKYNWCFYRQQNAGADNERKNIVSNPLDVQDQKEIVYNMLKNIVSERLEKRNGSK